MNASNRIIILIVAVFLVILLIGCHKNPEYIVTNALFDYCELDSDESTLTPYPYPGIRTGEVGSEYEHIYRYGYYRNGLSNVPPKRTVIIDGVPVKGEYMYSEQLIGENFARHFYGCGNEADCINIFTCNDKGDVLSFAYNYTSDKVETPKLSSQEMETIAREYLKQYVDTKDFAVTKIESKASLFRTQITFTRLINRIKSYENVGITFDNSTGKILSMGSCNLNIYKHSITAPVFDVKKAENTVLNLMKENSTTFKEFYIVEEARYWKSPILGWGLLIKAQSCDSEEYIGCVGGYYFVQ